MFCPIANCEGFCNKISNKKFNICNMGHQFCPICGELYHKDGKCKIGERVDELFKQYYKKYKLKKCPYCQIATLKNGGCNHITCLYCDKHWCWLCNTLFNSKEEHYGNIQSKCYDQMMDNYQNNNLRMCSKCGIETDHYEYFNNCDHIICNDCFENHLLENNFLIIFPPKAINCIIPNCNKVRNYSSEYLFRFINQTNNDNLIKKYKNSFLIFQYFTLAFFPNVYYRLYLDFILKLLERIGDFLSDKFSCCLEYDVFVIIGIVLGFITLGIYIIAIPIFPHLAIKNLYYNKFIKEFKSEHNNIILLIIIIIGEEILFLILIFPLMIINHLYNILFFPLLILIDLIRNKIYN